jgi:hypothetical protein
MAANCDMFGTGMMRFNEDQLYKKFLDVIDVPPLLYENSDLMFHIRFYARFLSIYVAKMKLDWANREQSFKGKAIQEECLRQIKERMMIEDAWHKYVLKKCNNDEKAFKRGFESYTDKFIKRNHCKVRKKKDVEITKVWRNCIPLSDYIGKESINLEYVICRRNIRRSFEKIEWQAFGYKFEKDISEAEEVSNCIFKGKIGCINNFQFYERRQEILDCECEEQTIDRHSTVGKSRGAADQILVFQKKINGMQPDY